MIFKPRKPWRREKVKKIEPESCIETKIGKVILRPNSFLLQIEKGMKSAIIIAFLNQNEIIPYRQKDSKSGKSITFYFNKEKYFNKFELLEKSFAI